MCKEAYRELATEFVMDALAEAKEKGWTYQMLAHRIGGSHHSYRHYAYGEANPAFPVVVGIILTAKPVKSLKKFLSLISLNVTETPVQSLPTSIGKAMKEFGEAIAEVTTALEDGVITEEEKKVCLKEINEAIDELIKLKNQLEKK